MNNPTHPSLLEHPTNPKLGFNDSILSTAIPNVGTLTNQFIFPQSTLFEETVNKGIKLPAVVDHPGGSTSIMSNPALSLPRPPSASLLSSLNIPSSSQPPIPPQRAEDQSTALLRLKASSTKNRSEQAKHLLQYYQTCKRVL